VPAVPAAASPAASKPRPVTPDEDLPAILDRIRRLKSRPVVAQDVTVSRGSPSADLRGPGGDPAIGVSIKDAADRQDVTSAYDLLLRGQYEGALTLYQKALTSSGNSVPALLGKATALHKLRRLPEAREAYRQVLAIDPENQSALTNMTAIVADQLPDQALVDLRTLERAYPSFSPIAAQIATLEGRRGNLVDAVAALNRAIALSPDNGLYRLNLAILQDKAGMIEEARASYRMALNMLGDASSLPLPLDQIRQRLRYLQGR
jgi:Flp pilus assembly protein TadD